MCMARRRLALDDKIIWDGQSRDARESWHCGNNAWKDMREVKRCIRMYINDMCCVDESAVARK